MVRYAKENSGVVALSSLYGGISTASGIKRRRQATKGIIMTDKKETDKKADYDPHYFPF